MFKIVKKNIHIFTIITLCVITILSNRIYSMQENSTIYNFKANSIDGNEVELSDYKGKLIIIVNTASECGNTPQYKGLEELYQLYKAKGLEILAFPCNQFGQQEPGSSEEIKKFCSDNYSVSFPIFEKVDVNGENSHPLFKYLRENAKGLLTNDIKWNFTKFMVNRDGEVIKRYSPKTKPESMIDDIEKNL